MLDLQDLFAESHREVGNVPDPPPEQWALIEQRLDAVRGKRRYHLVWRGGIFVGICLLAVIVWWWSEKPVARSLPVSPPTEAFPQNEAYPQVPLVSGEGTPVGKEEARKAAPLPAPVLVAPMLENDQMPPNRPAEKVTVPVTEGQSLESSVSPVAAELPVLPLAPTPPSAVICQHCQDSLFAIAVPTILPSQSKRRQWRFVPRIKPQRTPGRWEIGLYGMPRLTEPSETFTLLDEVPTSVGAANTVLAANGETLRLFDNGRTGKVGRQQRLNLNLVHLSVTRQFASGFRFSTGLLLENTPENKSLSVADLRGIVGPGEYALIAEDKAWELSGTAFVSYTLRRRKRLRFNVGVGFAWTFLRWERHRRYLYEDNAATITFQAEGRDNFLPINDAEVLPQVGVQYQLNRHFTVGLEFGPTWGIGGQYLLGQGWK